MFLASNCSRFQKEKELLTSGTYKLFKGKEESSDQKFLIKEISIEQINYSQTMQLFREFEILRKINYPSIIKLIECYKIKSNRLVMVFPYPEQGFLKDYIETDKKSVSDVQIEKWLIQLCLTLRFLHENYIIHKELKLENIYLNKQRDIELGNFSQVHILKDRKGSIPANKDLTVYTAPENIVNGIHNDKSDVWALGIIFYKLFTGTFPFNYKNENDLSTAVLNDTPRFEFEEQRKGQKEFIKQFLIKDHIKRPSIKQIIDSTFFKNTIERYPGLLNFSKQRFELKDLNFKKLQQNFNSLKIYRVSQLKQDGYFNFSLVSSESNINILTKINTMDKENLVLNNDNKITKHQEDNSINDSFRQEVKRDINDLSDSSYYSSDNSERYEEKGMKREAGKDKGNLIKHNNRRSFVKVLTKQLTKRKGDPAIKKEKRERGKSYLQISKLKVPNLHKSVLNNKLNNSKLRENPFSYSNMKKVWQNNLHIKKKENLRKVVNVFEIKRMRRHYHRSIQDNNNINKSFGKREKKAIPQRKIKDQFKSVDTNVFHRKSKSNAFLKPMKESIVSNNFNKFQKSFHLSHQMRNLKIVDKLKALGHKRDFARMLPLHKYVYLDYKNKNLGFNLSQDQIKRNIQILKNYGKGLSFSMNIALMEKFLNSLNQKEIIKYLQNETELIKKLQGIFNRLIKEQQLSSLNVYLRLLFQTCLSLKINK